MRLINSVSKIIELFEKNVAELEAHGGSLGNDKALYFLTLFPQDKRFSHMISTAINKIEDQNLIRRSIFAMLLVHHLW